MADFTYFITIGIIFDKIFEANNFIDQNSSHIRFNFYDIKPEIKVTLLTFGVKPNSIISEPTMGYNVSIINLVSLIL